MVSGMNLEVLEMKCVWRKPQSKAVIQRTIELEYDPRVLAYGVPVNV